MSSRQMRRTGVQCGRILSGAGIGLSSALGVSSIFRQEINAMVGENRMLRSDVYDQLKARLFAGQLRAGQFVSQRELATLLGATLNPVREAIRQLEAEGLIVVYAQRGIQIVEG